MRSNESQSDQILAYLKAGHSLTVMECVSLFNTPNLRSRISELIKQGHDIVPEEVKQNGKRFNRYRLISPQLKLILSSENQR